MHLKISCQQCPEYGKCSQKTKFYINYCGKNRNTLKPQIQKAILECRQRRGHVFKRLVLSTMGVKKNITDFSLPSAA